MLKLLRSRHIVQLVRLKSSKTLKGRKKIAVCLPDMATEKIKMWRKMLQFEINEHLAGQNQIKNLKFKNFSIDPIKGNIIECALPNLTQKDFNSIKQNFGNGAWIDLTIDDDFFTGFVTDLNYDTIKLRLKDLPPVAIHDGSKIVLSLPDDRFVLDFLLEFWQDEEWRKLPGVHNFLWAHRVFPPIAYGQPRGNVKFVNQKLNPSQKHAVELAMHPSQSLLTIQGPPGTGKTDVVAELIVQYYRKNKNVLVLASTNKAVDNVAERVCRLMNHNVGQYQVTSARSAQFSSPCSIHDAFVAHKDYLDLEKVCDENSELWENDNKLTRMRKNKPRDMYGDICSDIVSQANVIYATFTSSQVRKLRKQKFKPDLVIVDEAGQTPEALAWFGVLQANKAVIVGDQDQLGPLIRSEKAIDAGFGNSIMAYLYKEFGNKVQTRLQIQYRSNEKIMKWSSETFYDSELQADDSVKNICIQDLIVPTSKCYTEPLILLNTLHAGEKYHERRKGTSYMNVGEAQIVEEQVRALIESGLSPDKIGVITPYKGQVEHIRDRLDDIPNIQISSVDAFQGGEAEVICMSMVRSKQKDIELGFLNDLRRMNVSITRAKRQFFLVANSMTMMESKELGELYNTIKENGRVANLSVLDLSNIHKDKRMGAEGSK